MSARACVTTTMKGLSDAAPLRSGLLMAMFEIRLQLIGVLRESPALMEYPQIHRETDNRVFKYRSHMVAMIRELL